METKVQGSNTFLQEICAIPGGEGIRLCIQCGTCSASCPNVNRMDYTPRQLFAMARAGMREEVLSSNSMWFCLSCYLCTVRCPRGIKVTDLMHALDCLAVQQRLSSGRTYTPTMYRSFSDFVYSIGSVPEMSFMIWFYLLTNPLRAMKMMPMALSLLKHGRLSARARRLKPEAERQFKAILDKAESLGGIR
ncbi:MAG: 4Fe-4S dicluster domain-containing protein [Dehalococcoidia bacterium]|nr:4Fe-4S dicluster domain-containing protein [Dehalococcoidia bacterium]MBL7062522.1 4Fe-4S dicluster domain-containing protein [Dehalococcoidia bacterium]